MEAKVLWIEGPMVETMGAAAVLAPISKGPGRGSVSAARSDASSIASAASSSLAPISNGLGCVSVSFAHCGEEVVSYGGVMEVSWRIQGYRSHVKFAFGTAPEADLPEMLVILIANPRAVLTKGP